jgi:hypothetical protein
MLRSLHIPKGKISETSERLLAALENDQNHKCRINLLYNI